MIGLLLSCAGPLQLDDDHNARFEVELEVDLHPVAEDPGAVVIDWSELDVDLDGGALSDPIVRLQLLFFPGLSADEVATGLVNEELEQTELALAVAADVEGSSVPLAEFGLLEGPVDLSEWFVEGEGTWMLVLEDEGGRVRWLSFLEPTAGSAQTQITLSSDEGLLEVNGELGEAVRVVEDSVLDWSGLRTDTLGRELVHRKLDRAVLFGVEVEAAQLETEGLRLEELAVARIELGFDARTSLDLAELDLSDADRWILGLYCSTCVAPSPRVVLLLER